MSRTESTMLELGTEAPEFSLPDTVTGDQVSLSDIASDEATVVMFICNHCPYVQHIIERLVEVAREYEKKGVSFVAISSNDVENYPQDRPEKMKELAEELNFPFPYLYDESQEVAKAYKAACTPDFFVFNSDMELAYRGQFDDSRPQSGIPVSGESLTRALDRIQEGKEIPEDQQRPSVGCNIKWKN